jgi:hypothetical protein
MVRAAGERIGPGDDMQSQDRLPIFFYNRLATVDEPGPANSAQSIVMACSMLRRHQDCEGFRQFDERGQYHRAWKETGWRD